MIISSKAIFRAMFKPIKMQEVSANKIFICLIALSTFLISCSQCQDCELNGNTERICDTEFDNQDQFQNAIDDREAAGATCTPVSF
jgi:hypothetical protein